MRKTLNFLDKLQLRHILCNKRKSVKSVLMHKKLLKRLKKQRQKKRHSRKL